MEKLHFSKVINAPKEKVWNAMLGERSYMEWTRVFGEGSHYKGTWKKGSKILFLAPGKSGSMEGMVSRIAENKPYNYISIEHLGLVHDGKEDTQSDAVKGWAGAFENYTFKEKDTKTELHIDVDANEEFKDMFASIWPKALDKLKEIAEKK